MTWPGVIEAYRAWLPVTGATPIVTLLEGNTPLVRAAAVSRLTNLDIWLKYEGLNPTGSFKDRGMTMAMSKAVEAGAKAVICASTGNTAASAAAYAARSGLACLVVVPKGATALGKLAQAVAYGAKVLSLAGNFDQALALVRTLPDRLPVVLVNSVNPYRIEGQKTAAFEVCDALGRAPRYLAIPVGNAGNITAYWKGFVEYHAAGKVTERPVMLGFQAEGAAPIVRGAPVANPVTIATAIKIGNPASWAGATAAAKDSGGGISAVSDEEILEAYRLLAAKEGVFVEPASAASVAGVVKLAAQGSLPAGSTVVCVLTGHGLKDPDTALAHAAAPVELPAEAAAVEEAVAQWL